MGKELTVRIPYNLAVEIIKLLPPEEVKKVEKELEGNKKAPVFKLSNSPFFSHRPVDLGTTSVEDIDKIIAEQS